MTSQKTYSVQFGEDQYFDVQELSLTFIARVNGRDVTCLVSLDTLEDCFGCDWEDAEEDFIHFRPQLESVARTLITNGLVDSSQELRLRVVDLSSPSTPE